jgi:hypothetical protein
MNIKLKYLALSVALVLALTICLERPAYGYIDPGNGLLAMQSLSAMFTGAIFYFRRRLKSLVKKTSEKSDATVWDSAADPSL